MPLLRQAVAKVDAKIVVIDPILSAIDADSYKDQEIRRALSPLISFAEETGVTLVMVRHYTKQQVNSIQHKGAGSLAFINVSRVGLAIMPDPDHKDDNGMLLLHQKHNLTKEHDPLQYSIKDDNDDVARVVWNGTSNLSIKQIMEGPGASLGKTQQDILNMYPKPGYCHKTGDIVEVMVGEYGYTEDNVYQTLKRMRGKQLLSPERGKYCLPETTDSPRIV